MGVLSAKSSYGEIARLVW